MSTILQNEFRLLIMCLALQGTELRTSDMGLVRQKSMWWLHLYMIFKTMFLVTVSNALHYYGLVGAGWNALNIILDVIFSGLVYILYLHLWEGEALHILLVAMAGEFITYPFLGIVLLVNKLEGRGDLTMTEGPFMPADLLIPAGILLVFFVVRPQLRRLMHFVGNLYFPWRKALWTAFLCFFVYARIPAFVFENNLASGAGTLLIGEVAVIGVVFVLALMLFITYHSAMQKQEETLLLMQTRLLRQRALVLQNNRKEMREVRSLITAQMERIQDKLETGGKIDPIQMQDELEQLRQVRSKAYRGSYTSDSLLDEMLSQIKEDAEKHGTDTVMNVRHYDRGCIEEEDLVRLIFCLQQAIHNDESLEEISLTSTDEQLMLSMTTGHFSFSHRRFTTIQSILRKYTGTISVKRYGDKSRVLIALSKRGR